MAVMRQFKFTVAVEGGMLLTNGMVKGKGARTSMLVSEGIMAEIYGGESDWEKRAS